MRTATFCILLAVLVIVTVASVKAGRKNKGNRREGQNAWDGGNSRGGGNTQNARKSRGRQNTREQGDSNTPKMRGGYTVGHGKGSYYDNGWEKTLHYPTDCNFRKMKLAADDCHLVTKVEKTNKGNDLMVISSDEIAHIDDGCGEVKERVLARCMYNDVRSNAPCKSRGFANFLARCGMYLQEDGAIVVAATAVVPTKINQYVKREPWNCWKNLDAINFLCRPDHTYD